jgi:hypothetical protein
VVGRVRLPRIRLSGGATVAEQVESAGRPTMPDGDMYANLQTRPVWKGTLPSSVAELPSTPAMAQKIREYGGPDMLNGMLKLLQDLRRCKGTRNPIHPGTVAIEATFQVDQQARTMHAREVVLMASTLDERDDMPVLECLNLEMGKEVPVPEARMKLLGGSTVAVQRTDIGIPIETDGMYPWLFEDATP